ncbi:MAG: winged helix-turn-helix transcriptional regulator [Candidatus Thorarchaeota archaeon]|jgi:DNA-binding HxlR family transcriptional regulator
MESRSKEAVMSCPVFLASTILGKRWTILILQALMTSSAKDGLRFNEIHKTLDWISAKVLSGRLKELVVEGLVTREVDAEVIPPSVTYTLTDKGNDLRGVLTLMQEWGKKHGGSQAEECLGPGFEDCQGCKKKSANVLA